VSDPTFGKAILYGSVRGANGAVGNAPEAEYYSEASSAVISSFCFMDITSLNEFAKFYFIREYFVPKILDRLRP
jgi:hypothetical protein